MYLLVLACFKSSADGDRLDGPGHGRMSCDSNHQSKKELGNRQKNTSRTIMGTFTT